MATKGLGIALAIVACLPAITPAVADNPKSECDVVQVKGTGTRQPSGAITGNEVLTITATGQQIPIEFTSVALGITNVQDGKVSSISSADFKGVDNRNINFTTFDEVTTVPLQGDPSCTEGRCGLISKLKLVKGVGDYNCGEIVTGYDPSDPSFKSFTSTTRGGTFQFDSVGKLCKCNLSGND